jgi:hypothetical protein
MLDYDPFVRGPFPVGVRTIQSFDTGRNRSFPYEIWYPAAARHQGQDLVSELRTLSPFRRVTHHAGKQLFATPRPMREAILRSSSRITAVAIGALRLSCART